MKTIIKIWTLTLTLLMTLALFACSTTNNGANLSSEGQIALETSARIAVRHALDSPRAQEKMQHMRAIIVQVKSITTAESSFAALKDVVVAQIDKLSLAPIDKADALDLLNLFAAALEARLGSTQLDPQKLVQVNQFLDILLSLLPQTSAPT